MNLTANSSVAELRNELERRRKKAQELQLNTTDPDEWAVLNTLRWELEDLDRDIYLSQFIKNNDTLAKLAGEIEGASEGSQKLAKTIGDLEQALKSARSELNRALPMFDEIGNFIEDVENTVNAITVT